ncbi:MAG: 3-phosphoshikimate 1-carboxyvinyltransferase, partial [Gammaproteobacteria bacterium]
SAGAVAATFLTWIWFKKPDLSMALNGALAGLVAITAPCASVTTAGAVAIGLIGGSLAKALKQRKACREVLGYARHAETIAQAQSLGVLDRGFIDLEPAVYQADIIVICTPLSTYQALFELIASYIEAGASWPIITDVGSVKTCVVEAARAVWSEPLPRVVPAHPIAGSEKSGVRASDMDLFVNHPSIVTPMPDSAPHAVALVVRLWEAVGARVSIMSMMDHDRVLAETSHLPHLVAFAMVDALAGSAHSRQIFQYAAGGFRDFTRIAASDVSMWHDIFVANQAALEISVEKFQVGLTHLLSNLADGNGAVVRASLARAREARQEFTQVLQQRGMRTQVSRPITIEVTVHGVGLHGLQAPTSVLDMGNSGTSIRLLSGLLAGQSFDVTLLGDVSLNSRPMRRVTDPLMQMGAVLETSEAGTPPVHVRGRARAGRALKGIHYDLPMPSAQVKSAILLAGLYAEGETSVSEPAPTRDHTERMLSAFGVQVARDGNCIRLQGGQTLTGTSITVPADISSAAFFLVAASIVPGSDLTLQAVGLNPTRTGILSILKQMGADITLENERTLGGEPVADLRVRGAALKGICIPKDLVPLAIDEFPVLFIAAVCAEGQTVLTGAEELRVKESDRIQVMADGLARLGVKTQVTPDGIVIEGGQVMRGGVIETHHDHRIAMAFAVAALRATAPILIRGCDAVATSFPGFAALARTVGMRIEEQVRTVL